VHVRRDAGAVQGCVLVTPATWRKTGLLTQVRILIKISI
jgi:hypothetical protein